MCILRSVSAQLSTPLPSSPTLANFLIGCLGLHLGGLHRKAVNALLLALLSVRAEPLMSRAPPPSFIVHVCILQTFSEWQPSLYVCPPEPAGKMQIVCKKNHRLLIREGRHAQHQGLPIMMPWAKEQLQSHVNLPYLSHIPSIGGSILIVEMSAEQLSPHFPLIQYLTLWGDMKQKKASSTV